MPLDKPRVEMQAEREVASNQPKPTQTQYVCTCAQITRHAIEKEIANHPCTLADLQSKLGCGVECGSCVPDLQKLLGINAWIPATATCQVVASTQSLAPQDQFYAVKVTPERAYPSPTLGQNVIFKHTLAGHTSLERTYTIVDFDSASNTLTIIAKQRLAGKLTPVFAESAKHNTPIQLEISEPVGGTLVVDEDKPIVFFAAGSGITPAIAYVNQHAGQRPLYLDYSASHADAFIETELFAQTKTAFGTFDYTLRDTSISGRIQHADVAQYAADYPDAQFLICGPDSYTQLVSSSLWVAGIPNAAIHTEAFYIDPSPAKRAPSIKKMAYTIAFFLCLLPLIFLFDNTENVRPHGVANIGHEKLKCIDCHQAPIGTLRQQIQAKLSYALGMRKSNVNFGNQAVSTKTCIECHANPDDRHPAQRFLEPKYEKARKTLAVQECITCHREHNGRRVTVQNTTYCMHCHEKTIVKNDPAIPTHKTLIQEKRWQTCLQCHDFHGNHRFKTPLKLEEAHQLNTISAYLNQAKNPYGPIKLKAKQPEKDKK